MQTRGVVRDRNLDQLQPPAAGLGDGMRLRIGDHACNEAGGHARLQLRDGHELRAVLVGAGIEAHQILGRVQTELFQKRRTLRPDAGQRQQRIFRSCHVVPPLSSRSAFFQIHYNIEFFAGAFQRRLRFRPCREILHQGKVREMKEYFVYFKFPRR